MSHDVMWLVIVGLTVAVCSFVGTAAGLYVGGIIMAKGVKKELMG